MSDDRFSNSRVRHGTASGFREHQSRGEEACPSCKAAKAEYDKRWRSSDRQTRISRLNARAQSRAYRRLAHRFPDIYRALYLEERASLEAEREATL